MRVYVCLSTCMCVCVGEKAKEGKTNTCCHQPLLECSRDITDAIRLGRSREEDM